MTISGAAVLLDTDKNGQPDYGLLIGADKTGSDWIMVKYPGAKPVRQSPTMHYTRTGNTYTFTLASADIGGATEFNINATALTLDKANKSTLSDLAPDGGQWSYAMTTVRPMIGVPSTSLAAPVAGKSFVMTFPVTRSDSGDKLKAGELSVRSHVTIDFAGKSVTKTTTLHVA